MKNLRKLSAVVVLTFALALSAFAGETATPPCADPAPGQTETPPCATQLLSSDVNKPADMGKTAWTRETMFTRIAADFLLNFLPLI